MVSFEYDRLVFQPGLSVQLERHDNPNQAHSESYDLEAAYNDLLCPLKSDYQNKKQKY